MPLPIVPLPSETLQVNGADVTIHSLSRGDALALRALTDETEAEVFLLIHAADTTEKDARAFVAKTTTAEAGRLVNAIMVLSGLAAPDPKALPRNSSTKGHS